MNILFYYPSNQSTVVLDSQMEAFQNEGHRVFLLTQSPLGDLHNDVKKYGVKINCHVAPSNISLLFYISQFVFLLLFIRKNKIAIVYSHLQKANIISVFAQYFTNAKFILCRHHDDRVFKGNNLTAKLFDKMINLLGKTQIVPSKKVYNQVMNIERVSPSRIKLIPYTYNFNNYLPSSIENVDKLQRKYNAGLRLINIGRLVHGKRHFELINIISKMIRDGYDIVLLLLGDGILMNGIVNHISHLGVGDRIICLGHQKNIMDYIASSDLMIHLSENEASNNAIKEAAIEGKTVVVCENVGDFDDYIVHNQNGFKVPLDGFEGQLEELIKYVYNHKSVLNQMGQALKKDVLNKFSIEKIIKQYQELNSGNVPLNSR